jgi:hypothetical protein
MVNVGLILVWYRFSGLIDNRVQVLGRLVVPVAYL